MSLYAPKNRVQDNVCLVYPSQARYYNQEIAIMVFHIVIITRTSIVTNAPEVMALVIGRDHVLDQIIRKSP